MPLPPESGSEYESEDCSLGLEDVAGENEDFQPDDLARIAAARLLPVEWP